MVLPLAPGWEEVRDENTGGVYYWNTTTDATAWERPTAQPPPPPQQQQGGAPSGSRAYSAASVFTSEELGGDVGDWMRKNEVVISAGCPAPLTTFEAAR